VYSFLWALALVGASAFIFQGTLRDQSNMATFGMVTGVILLFLAPLALMTGVGLLKLRNSARLGSWALAVLGLVVTVCVVYEVTTAGIARPQAHQPLGMPPALGPLMLWLFCTSCCGWMIGLALLKQRGSARWITLAVAVLGFLAVSGNPYVTSSVLAVLRGEQPLDLMTVLPMLIVLLLAACSFGTIWYLDRQDVKKCFGVV